MPGSGSVRLAFAAAAALSFAGCHYGMDGAPAGCTTLKVTHALYTPRANRIEIRLSNGSSYWATGLFEYLNERDKHIGPYDKGSDVIVCSSKSRTDREIRSNIVGNMYLTFHRIPGRD